MISPISHNPMHLYNANQGNRGHSTARGSSLNNIDLGGTQVHFTKTSIQARAEGQVKPKAYNAWDILALNDLIKDKVETQNRKMREQKERLEMRSFYDR